MEGRCGFNVNYGHLNEARSINSVHTVYTDILKLLNAMIMNDLHRDVVGKS